MVHTSAIVSIAEPTETPEIEGDFSRKTTSTQQALTLHDNGTLPATSDDISMPFLPAAGGASPEGHAAVPDDTHVNQAAALNSSAQVTPPDAVHQAVSPQNVQRHQEASTGPASADADAGPVGSGLICTALGGCPPAHYQLLLPSLLICKRLLLLLHVSILLKGSWGVRESGFTMHACASL